MFQLVDMSVNRKNYIDLKRVIRLAMCEILYNQRYDHPLIQLSHAYTESIYSSNLQTNK